MKRNGFTFIEMMIAITLSLFLLTFLSDVFFSMKKVMAEQEEMATMESQALQVMRYLNQYVPYAGFIGCVNVNRTMDIMNHTATQVNHASVLFVNNKGLSVKLAENSQLVGEPMGNLSDILVNNAVGFEKNNVVVINDCSTAEVDQIASIRKVINKSSYKITLAQPLSKLYKPYVSIAVLHSYRFFLRQVSYGQPVSALFMTDAQGREQELVAGIDHLEFNMLPNPQQAKAILVSFTVTVPGKDVESSWQFVIPLLERI